ncbi:DsbE family thiol:disulfide interchange protein [Limoniibacter endophyticus]|uniref:Thiol:disulfide interchange protein n=1 Tax=Limoniibacter endophyticus TaxID=1565040 RepID=A0A8J3DT73_9HYPH|nr:DsbE family thiol:disulfide interchange protein [Limoniibacter endophyticus]GHC74238.1 thiol:disulfide interchange protein [Limoniibacter endophyticus]
MRKRNLLIFLPLTLFFGLCSVFLLQLTSGRDAAVIPSALVGSEAPRLELPALEGSAVPSFSAPLFQDKVTLVNVWASWCAPCRDEHPLLIELAKDPRFSLVGINYKDVPANAWQFLSSLGNPYSAIGVDANGRSSIEWGVYGVPETFLVDGQGTVVYRHVGPITRESLKNDLMPQIEKLLVSS